MKSYSKLIVFGVITLLLISFTFSFVASAQNQRGDGQGGNGHGNPPDDVGKNKRQYEKRNVEMNKHQKQAEIRSSWKGDNSEDSLNMNFNFRENYPKITIDYEGEKENKQVQLSFKLVFKKIFEFVDENQNGRYDGGDEIVNSQDLNQVRFKNINYENKPNGYKFNTETIDSKVRFQVQGDGNFSKSGQQILSPSEAKIDLEFNYEFEREDTMLGLKIDIQTQNQNHVQRRTFDEERGYASDETGLRFTKNNYSGFFTWADNAVVDGENRPVNATFISETGVKLNESEINGNDVLYLCYQQGSEIVHDPKVGVVGESSLSFTSVEEEPIQFFLIVLGASIGISAAVFYSGVYYRRKKD